MVLLAMDDAVTFTPEFADRRFGTGLSPDVVPPASVDAMLDRLVQPDHAAGRFPVPLYADVTPSFLDLRNLRRARDDSDLAEAAFVAGRTQMNALRQSNFAMTLARGTTSDDGFRERLTRFWADHFTVIAKNALMPHLVTPYVEEAIRPNMTGRFVDLLFAAATHPMMVIFLDQARSVGPNSPVGINNERGLNENLAREVLELHTMGVDGPYSQDDVRELAEVFTGLSWSTADGRTYRPRFAEPGSEVLLGTTLSAEADISIIVDAFETIAAHPATAQHVAKKLARHFVADEPSPDLVEAMASAYTDTGGDLLSVYRAMLEHPAAWATSDAEGNPTSKSMKPFDFLQSSLRALAVAVDQIPLPIVNRTLRVPLRLMGQDWERPKGPDGWAEDADAWINPHGMAGRITWAMSVPSELTGGLPDPRSFVHVALGQDVPRELAFAARAAEDRAAGIGLVLASAAFQRRA